MTAAYSFDADLTVIHVPPNLFHVVPGYDGKFAGYTAELEMIASTAFSGIHLSRNGDYIRILGGSRLVKMGKLRNVPVWESELNTRLLDLR